MQKLMSKDIGYIGEEYISQYLMKNGFSIIHRNLKIENYEIDIVAKKDKTLYFVEVKTRNLKNTKNFPPEISINRKKKENLSKAINTFISENSIYKDYECEIEVFFVYLKDNRPVKLEEFKGV